MMRWIVGAVALCLCGAAAEAQQQRCQIVKDVKVCLTVLRQMTARTRTDAQGVLQSVTVYTPDVTDDPRAWAKFAANAISVAVPEIRSEDSIDLLKRLMRGFMIGSSKSIRLGPFEWSATWRSRAMSIRGVRRP